MNLGYIYLIGVVVSMPLLWWDIRKHEPYILPGVRVFVVAMSAVAWPLLWGIWMLGGSRKEDR